MAKTNAGNKAIEKSGLHPRNAHRFGYDFVKLTKNSPALSQYVSVNQFNKETIDFSNPDAVKSLNGALLKDHYNLQYWDIPAGYLVPPVPGRADYIHNAADLLASVNKGTIPTGHTIRVLDVGVGASCIYPIIGIKEYAWSFTGSDIDANALKSAQQIIDRNPSLQGTVELRLQKNPANPLYNLVTPEDEFDLVICNPPFHSSLDEMNKGVKRKWNNLKIVTREQTVLNFGGQSHELIFPGGEDAFVSRLIIQSAHLPTSSYWYTSLVSKEITLKHVQQALTKVNVVDSRTINMSQGQKQSRLIAWTFLSPREQRNWRERHFWTL